MEKPGKHLPFPEWDALIEDFQLGNDRHTKWLKLYPSPSLLELTLNTILRREFPLKTQLIIFLEEFSGILISDSDANIALGSVVQALRSIVESAVDGVAVTYALKEQMMVSMTSVMIVADGLRTAPRHLENLVALLLSVINRPNHGTDRQSRAVACECLRELERAYPCLLFEILGHLWALCQSERTHAAQNYILLLTTIVNNLVSCRAKPSSVPSVSILFTPVPLVPFNVPNSVANQLESDLGMGVNAGRDLSPANLKELRKVVAFLLEEPELLTPFALLEFVSMLMTVASKLGLQVSLLKVQFSGLLYSSDPILWHIVLMLYLNFSDAFHGEEGRIARRLALTSKELSFPLVFRLLSMHWLMCLEQLGRRKEKKHTIGAYMPSAFYPHVFDPLALKALKLDFLMHCIIHLDGSLTELRPSVANELYEVSNPEIGASCKDISIAKLFEESLECVSAFKWLPPNSTETMIAFRLLHKFASSASPSEVPDAAFIKLFTKSVSCRMLESILVKTLLEFRRLVPVVVTFVDRLLDCKAHQWLGEHLLQTFDSQLLGNLASDQQLTSYFPIFDKISVNDKISPCTLLNLLMTFVVGIVQRYDPEKMLIAWSQGSKVLSICRTLLMHHHSSRIFHGLSVLLSFICRFFPDLEVRDNARFYLRMLLCIPGKKLKHILDLNEQLPTDASATHLSSLFQTQSPRASCAVKRRNDLSSYVFLDRVVTLIVKQSWSLIVPYQAIEDIRNGDLPGAEDSPSTINVDVENEIVTGGAGERTSEIKPLSQEPLRVTDSNAAKILGILRRHFAIIPDFRNMPGIKIKIPCILRFQAAPTHQLFGIDLQAADSEGNKEQSALYAVTISFSSPMQYGKIPKSRIPFLCAEPRTDNDILSEGHHDNTSIILYPKGGETSDQMGHPLDKSYENVKGLGTIRALVNIELEPREPVPGVVDISIDATMDNGQTIRGTLHSVTVGIEDMFTKASTPPEIPIEELPRYNLDLFQSLWEACGSASNFGRETFPLKGGKGVVSIHGTRTVKMLEAPFDVIIRAVERFLSAFVVSVVGDTLVDLVKHNGVIEDVIWQDDSPSPSSKVKNVFSCANAQSAPLLLKYVSDETDPENQPHPAKREMGSILVLILLPARFHLLLQMEVSEFSTLVKIRTDHWPCLAYIDEYLEALVFT